MGGQTASACRVTPFNQWGGDGSMLVIREEGALARVDGGRFELLYGKANCVSGRFKFFTHRCVAHRTIVGIESDAKFFLIENLERMFVQTARSPGMNIAQQANLQRNSFVENVLRKVA